jgi:outer membrane protein OmpA-like peptidoglycan-associated protein
MRCASCEGSDYRWWDTVAEAWHQPDLEPTGAAGHAGIWIQGDFEGDVSGAQVGSGISSEGSYRQFQTPIRRGKLLNPQAVAGPPLRLDENERLPLREAAVGEVEVRFGRASESTSKVTLHDFRLHRWESPGMHEVETSAASLGKRAVAAVRGKAYAFLPRKLEQPPPSPPSEDANAAPDWMQRAQNAAQDAWAGAVVRVEDTRPALDRALPTQTATAEPDADDCAACKLLARVVTALGFWIFCTWKMALLGVLGLSFLVCWLSRRIPVKVRPERMALAAVPLLLSAVGIALLVLGVLVPACPPAYGWALLLPLLGCLASVFFRPCWVRTALAVMWLVALALHCGFHDRQCPVAPPVPPKVSAEAPNQPSVVPAPQAPTPEGGSWVTAPFRWVAQPWNGLIQWLREVFSFDSTAEVVSQVTENLEDGRRLSIDQSLAKPQLLNDCKTAIYFPHTFMFDFDSDRINPEVESQLLKMEKLKDALPGRELIITGHADKAGSSTPEGVIHNIDLSERRAAAVATWLSDRTRWAPELIEALGAGSKFPLIDKEGEVPVNRRVEIRLRCHPKGAS